MTRTSALSRRARRTTAALASIALTVGVAISASPSYAAAGVTMDPLTVSTISEAPDYSTTVFSDAWDYSNVEDMRLYGAGQITGGRLMFQAGDGFPANLVPYVPGAHPIGRDGPANPIDGRKYTHMAMRLYSSNKGSAAVLWSTCDWKNTSCRGSKNFPVQQGWSTIKIPMHLSANWTRVIALKLLPTNVAKTRIQLDWARLYEPAAGVDITWSDDSPGRAATVFWDSDDDLSNNTADNPGWGEVEKLRASQAANTTTFDAAAFPPGDYRFYVSTADGESAYTTPLTVVARPRPVILAPSSTSGAEYAATVRRDAWDMSQPSDGTPQFATTSFRGGVLNGRNLGGNRDPAVTLTVPKPINGSQFHYAHFRMWVEGPFSLGFEPGGGSMARITWKVAGSEVWQNTNDMVVFPGWNEIVIDLATSPATKIVEPEQGGKIGWAGKQIVTLRFDPNEDIGRKNWRIDFVRLTETPTARGAYDIVLQDEAAQVDSVVEIYADTKFGTYAGTQIATATPVASGGGTTTYHWDPPTSLRPGTYWIWVKVSNAVGSTRRYSSAPVKITPLDGVQ